MRHLGYLVSSLLLLLFSLFLSGCGSHNQNNCVGPNQKQAECITTSGGVSGGSAELPAERRAELPAELRVGRQAVLRAELPAVAPGDPVEVPEDPEIPSSALATKFLLTPTPTVITLPRSLLAHTKAS